MACYAPEVRVRNANERNVASFMKETFFKMKGYVFICN